MSSKKKSRVTWKDVAPPLVAVILSALLILGIVQVASQNGLSFPTINLPPWLTGQNGTTGNTVTGVFTYTWTDSSGTHTTTTTGGGGGGVLIPTGTLSFKMVVTANYADGTNETVFEKSTLQGFAVLNNPTILGLIKLHGKVVNRAEADAVVALAFDNPMPTGAKAHFLLNYTVWVSDPNACQHISYGQTLCAQGSVNWKAKSIIQNVDAQLIQSNTIAMAVLPTLPVSATDIFPSDVTSPTNRTVLWTLDAKVTVSGPNMPTFALTGSTLSNANFNADGSITVCTNCTPSSPPGESPPGSSPIISGPITLGGGKAEMDLPDHSPGSDWCKGHPNVVSCSGGEGTPPETTQGQPTNTAPGPTMPVYVAVTNSYTIAVTQTLTQSPTTVTIVGVGQNPVFTPPPVTHTVQIPVTNSYQQCVANCPVSVSTRVTFNSDGGVDETRINHNADGSTSVGRSTHYDTTETDSEGGFGAAKNPGDYGLRPKQGETMFDLVLQFDSGATTYRINLWFIILAFIVAGAFVAIFMGGYFVATHKRRRR